MSALAATPPPAAPPDAFDKPAPLKQRPSTGLKMGSFFIEFEKTTLDDVRHAASAGTIAHDGDAGESVYWLCYTNLSPAQVERVWVIADGEMGGNEHAVTGVVAQVIPNGAATGDCPALPDRLTALSLGDGMWLGASKGAVVSGLGAPPFEKNRWSSFNYEGKVAGHCPGNQLDLDARLQLHADNGRIDWLQAGQVTSC
jgi:hypothetical protein